MSLSFQPNGAIFGPVAGSVIDQLEARKSIIGKRSSRTSEDIQFLNSNSGWCRVMSSVNTDPQRNDYENSDNYIKEYTNIEAKRGILAGGTLTEDYTLRGGYREDTNGKFSNRSAYNYSEINGTVPMAGITDFSVKSKGVYGTLRESTFTFIAHSVEQFNTLEQLYLHPGFTVMLEWGHSVFVDNKGILENGPTLYNPDTFFDSQKHQDIYTEISRLKEINFNNYDALYGYIKNFSWSFNGQNYICQVDVISRGEIVEGLRADFYPDVTTETQQDVKYGAKKHETEYSRILNSIKNAPVKKLFDSPSTVNRSKEIKDSVLKQIEKDCKKYKEDLKDIFVAAAELGGNVNREMGILKYITLRDFFNIINITSLIKADKEYIVSYYTGRDKISNYTTFPDHIGLDPYICVLPKTSTEDSRTQYSISNQGATLDETDILDIMVSVEYLLQEHELVNSAKRPEDRTITSLIKNIVEGISSNLGEINKFGLQFNEDESYKYLVDRSCIPSKDDLGRDENNNPIAYIDLVGLKSQVTNLNVVSTISANMTAMMSIAAQASPDGDSLNLYRWNVGLQDRHQKIKEIGKHDTKPDVPTEEEETEETRQKKETESKFYDFLNTISNNKNNYFLSYSKQEIDGYRTIHQKITSDGVLKNSPGKSNAPGLIPFKLTFTTKGIGGMRVGEVFNVNEYFLPERYKGRVAFVIIGLGHKVQNNTWTTDVETQIFLT